MKIKRLILLIISFLAFLGLGLILSRQQSQRADQVLSNNGLSSTYYVFNPKKKHNIKQFLTYVNKKFSHDKVQIHFESDYIPDRVLIWANYNLKSQPLAKGSSRYFSKNDFDGTIPFAVISSDTKDRVVTLQNNHYLKENNDYVTIIGELKKNNESQNGEAVYYLSTGINQPTAKESITNYKVVVDGLNKNEANALQHYLRGSMQIKDFSKTYNRQHGISPTKKLIAAILCVVIALIVAAIAAVLAENPVNLKYVSSKIWAHLLADSGLRFFLANGIIVILTSLGLQTWNFYSNHSQLYVLFLVVFAMQIITYVLMLLLIKIKKEK
ncbi:hypothetical protein [Lactobacillus johnsonii]|uniref:hypothetical protein n=1 Tax=Lactobacillus johnsonii TaxID=33959 RepID=UPI0028E3CE9F|nr:hypothetical protein [Lactobacillus johnsonii]MDT9605723.1 hypothetical protein [Lactobacillus johnsonii]